MPERNAFMCCGRSLPPFTNEKNTTSTPDLRRHMTPPHLRFPPGFSRTIRPGQSASLYAPEGDRVSHGTSFLAPGSLARRRLARLIHHHHQNAMCQSRAKARGAIQCAAAWWHGQSPPVSPRCSHRPRPSDLAARPSTFLFFFGVPILFLAGRSFFLSASRCVGCSFFLLAFALRRAPRLPASKNTLASAHTDD